jgi:hypothetical protein
MNTAAADASLASNSKQNRGPVGIQSPTMTWSMATRSGNGMFHHPHQSRHRVCIIVIIA